jgi:hypothetical protein
MTRTYGPRAGSTVLYRAKLRSKALPRLKACFKGKLCRARLSPSTVHDSATCSQHSCIVLTSACCARPLFISSVVYVFADRVDGLFLIRESTTIPGRYCATVHYNGAISHILISANAANQYFIGSAKHCYVSLTELVEAYMVCKPKCMR